MPPRRARGRRGPRPRARGPSAPVCVLHHDEQGPPAFAALLGRRRPAAAARPAARGCRGRDRRALRPPRAWRCPCSTLIAESEGVALRVHRAASGWAQAQAAVQLAATAGRAAVDQAELRATQAALPAASSTCRGPASGPASTPSRSRRIPRSPRCVRSAAWRRSTPPTPSTSSAASASSPSSSPAWSARPCSRWSAPQAAASPRSCVPAFCRRWPTGSSPARSAGARW